MIKIRLNGTVHEIDGAMNVSDFLANVGMGGKPVVVELNEEAVFPRDYDETTVNEGARVEVVALAAGG